MSHDADLSYEVALRDQGFRLIAGLDEAGRGAWAGPVVVGAVILPLDQIDLIHVLQGVDDSKKLSPYRRNKLLPVITGTALAFSVAFASHDEIDTIGIVPATRLAMQRALAQLPIQPEALLTDVVQLPESSLPCTPLVRGDQKSLSIAAASIIAKVTRDRHMIELDVQYPEYGFMAHKGYGTLRHQRALAAFGPTPIHRKTFAPIRRLLEFQDRPL